jgi:hypothetical protein
MLEVQSANGTRQMIHEIARNGTKSDPEFELFRVLSWIVLRCSWTYQA